MTSFTGLGSSFQRRVPFHMDLHEDLRAQLWDFGARFAGEENEAVVRGPLGVGKTRLLERLYQGLFGLDDGPIPLLIQIPQTAFHPFSWVRHFLKEVARQWVAFERRDAGLLQVNLPLAHLAGICRQSRLHPLAEVLENIDMWKAESEEASAFLGWAMESVGEAALQLGKRVVLIIDGAENAVWHEDGLRVYLTNQVWAAGKASLFRRIWSMRGETSGSHPMVAPLPPMARVLDAKPLSPEDAGLFAASLARHLNLDYDEDALRDFLPLWGGIPKWLGHFVQEAVKRPQPVASAEQIVSIYLEDITSGLSARSIQASLNDGGDAGVDPFILAQTAERFVPRARTAATFGAGSNLAPALPSRILQTQEGEGKEPNLMPRGQERPPLQGIAQTREANVVALGQLARAGLIVYRDGRWKASEVPVLEDFLRLYVARDFYGEDSGRTGATIKRDRLMESRQFAQNQRRENEIRMLQDVLGKFAGQAIPARHLRAHRMGDAQEPVSSGILTLPYCINTHVESKGAHAEKSGIPVVVGWCFTQPGYYRSDEMLWVACVIDAAVVTSEEVDSVELISRRIGRELGVPQTVAWIVSDGRYSAEGKQRISDLGFHSSSWHDCETIQQVLHSDAGSVNAGNPDMPREDRKDNFVEASAAAPANGTSGGAKQQMAPEMEEEDDLSEDDFEDIVAGTGADRGGGADAHVEESAPFSRAIPTGSAQEHVVELHLPPRADMELVAANNIEQLGAKCGFPEKAISQMKMAALEACLNAIEHSRNREKEVHVRLEASPQKFVILVENEGMIFDPQMVEDPNIDEKMTQSYKRGWGLKLIKKFMDRVVFEPYDRGTRLRMEKYNTNDPAGVAADSDRSQT